MGRWEGEVGRGPREYDALAYDRVVRCFLVYQGDERAVMLEDFCKREVPEIPPRTVRAILSDADGVEFLIGEAGEGFYVATHYEDGYSFTRNLEARARTLAYRAERRRQFADRLPRRQGQLFPV